MRVRLRERIRSTLSAHRHEPVSQAMASLPSGEVILPLVDVTEQPEAVLLTAALAPAIPPPAVPLDGVPVDPPTLAAPA